MKHCSDHSWCQTLCLHDVRGCSIIEESRSIPTYSLLFDDVMTFNGHNCSDILVEEEAEVEVKVVIGDLHVLLLIVLLCARTHTDIHPFF